MPGLTRLTRMITTRIQVSRMILMITTIREPTLRTVGIEDLPETLRNFDQDDNSSHNHPDYNRHSRDKPETRPRNALFALNTDTSQQTIALRNTRKPLK